MDKISGGLSDGKPLSDIARHHGRPIGELQSQLAKGVKVEMEHTDDEEVAREIAMDHLWEDPAYYDKLARVEERLVPTFEDFVRTSSRRHSG